MILNCKYRLLLNKRQHLALNSILESQRDLYNAALQEREDCYRKTGRGRSYYDQCLALTQCRKDLAEMGAVPLSIQRWTIKRLDDAYRAAFRRIKAGESAGFPRARTAWQWRSFGFQETDGLAFDGRRLRFRGCPGGVRVHLHRTMPSDDIRSCVFRREGRIWFICFQLQVAAQPEQPDSPQVGIDLGLQTFAYRSDGATIEALRPGRRAQAEMRRRQRAVGRRRRASRRRAKAAVRVAALNRKIANTRRTWLHQQTAALVRNFGLVAVEQLNIRGLSRARPFARSIGDASWATFIAFLTYKTELAGKRLVKVNPRNTSQACSSCGELVHKSLAVRTHACGHCGLVIDRDWNASLNILNAAVAGRRAANVAHLRASVGSEISAQVETLPPNPYATLAPGPT